MNSLSLTFDGRVALESGALGITRRDGSPVAGVTVSVTNPSRDERNWVLTFGGPAVVGGSLPDGIYKLVATSAGVADLAGNALASDYTVPFHRLFGDSDGDRDVDSTDLALFKNRAEQTRKYVWYFDFDGNGVISKADYVQLKSRSLRSVPRTPAPSFCPARAAGVQPRAPPWVISSSDAEPCNSARPSKVVMIVHTPFGADSRMRHMQTPIYATVAIAFACLAAAACQMLAGCATAAAPVMAAGA